MRLVVRSQLRFLRYAPWSAVTAAVGVALGVASVVAVHLICAQVERSLDDATPPHLSGLTHLLDRPGLTAGHYFDLRDAWRADDTSALVALVPMVEGQVLVGGRRTLVIGADWLALPAGEAQGRLQVPVDVLLGRAVLADETLGVAAGDTVEVSGRPYRVAALLNTGLGAALVADIAAAHAMLDLPPSALSRVGAAARDPWAAWRHWLDRLMPGFSAGLPALPGSPEGLVPGVSDGASDGPWRVLPAAAEQPGTAFARSVLFNLGALGTLALLVAWFLIYQVGVIWLRRQHLLLSRLAVVGVSEGALRSSFLIVFVGLGALATVVGLGVGLVLAEGLLARSARGLDVAPAAATALDGWVLLKAVVSGLGVCLAGGWAAFTRERRPAGRRWQGTVAGILMAVAVAGIGLPGTGVLGGFLAILAMSLAAVLAVAPALGLLRQASGRLPIPMLDRLALREVAWYPQVLEVALGALTLAVATGIGIGLMVASFRLDFDRMLSARLAGDLYVQRAAGSLDTVEDWLAAQPDVRRATRSGRERVRVGGVPVELGYGRFDVHESARYGYPGGLGAGEALISERLARDLDVGVGDALVVGEGTLEVKATFPGFGDTTGRLVVDVSSLPALAVTPRFDRLTLWLVEPSDLPDRLAARFPDLAMESRAAIRSLALGVFDRTFAITQALTVLALLVAVVGMYNALTALRLNQAATLRLLESQGVTVAESRRMSLIRAATAGGMALVLALPLGVLMAWTLCSVINPRSFGWTVDLQFPVQGWLPPLALGLLAALLAGALPAPRERGSLHEGA